MLDGGLLESAGRHTTPAGDDEDTQKDLRRRRRKFGALETG